MSRRISNLAVSLVVPLALAGCTDEASQAEELGFDRPAGAAPWCDVVPDSDVRTLVDSAERSGTPWQSFVSRDLVWSCTIAPDLRGRGLDHEETSPALLSLDSRLFPASTAAVRAAGNDSPVGETLGDDVVAHGHGVWSAAPLGQYVVRRPCPRRDDASAVPPDELQVQLGTTEPRALPAERLREIAVSAWGRARDSYGCLPRGPGSDG